MLFLTSCKDRVNCCPEMAISFEKILNYVYRLFSNVEETLTTSQRQIHFLSSLGIFIQSKTKHVCSFMRCRLFHISELQIPVSAMYKHCEKSIYAINIPLLSHKIKIISKLDISNSLCTCKNLWKTISLVVYLFL